MSSAVWVGPAESVLADLQARTVCYLAEYAPSGALGAPGAEAGLARVCWVLSQLEDAYRCGELPVELADRLTGPDVTAEQLRAIAPEHAVAEHAVAELVELARRFRDFGTLAEFHRLADNPPGSSPLGVAAPVFVPNWADGDVLLGNTLIDIKTVIKLDQPERTARWLWQLLAYAWLDTTDRYRIRTVGLYLARHGVLVTWGLAMFADHLLGEAGQAAGARREFLQLAREVIRAEGGQPPPEGEQPHGQTLPWR